MAASSGEVKTRPDLDAFLAGRLGDPGDVLEGEGRGGHEQAVGGVVADQALELLEVAQQGQGVGPDHRVGPADIAEGHEAGAGVVEDVGQAPGLGAGPDDQGPERQAAPVLQAELVVAPGPAGDQLEAKGEHPGDAHPEPREVGMGPVAGHHQQHNPDAGRAEDPAEFFRRREVLGRVQAERLECRQPQQRREEDRERFPDGHRPVVVAQVVADQQGDDQAGGVGGHEAAADLAVAAQGVARWARRRRRGRFVQPDFPGTLRLLPRHHVATPPDGARH
jgi:hypothetical protein